MYYAHFGLSEAPFRITPNTDVFFTGANRGAILDALVYAISQGEGIIKVTGEVGTGKTMLCGMLQSRLPPVIETVYLAHPSVSPEEILRSIGFELQLSVARDASRMELMQALYAYLLDRHAAGKQVVIFVEESQNMPIATLEEVRLLSNLETGKHKLLQIVLFGQPELDQNLRQPSIRQLRERITHSFTLPPLGVQEVGDYLMFRLRAAGYRGPDLFGTNVVRRIAQASEGLTRRINLIADKALLAAFSENTHTIEPRHVAAAVRDSEFARDTGPTGAVTHRRWVIPVAAAAITALAVTAFFLSPSGKRLVGVETPAGSPAPVRASQSPSPIPTPTGGAPVGTHEDIAVGSASAATATAGSPPTQAQPPPSSAPAKPAIAPPVAGAPQAAASPTAETTPAAAVRAREAVAEPGDVLAQRIASTREWLRTQGADTLTIQLLGAENPQQLKDHLSTIAKSIEISNIFVYRTLAGKRPFLTVLYGSFDRREDALNALEHLPAHLKTFKPYLRTVQGIRAEMSRNNTL